MRNLRRYATSRRWLTVTLICIVAACLVWAVGGTTYTLLPRSEFPLAIAGQIPAIAAIAVQVTSSSVLEQQETTAARSMRLWRLAHVVVLTTVAAAGFIVASSFVHADFDTGLALVRNTLAFTGAALIGAALIGPWFAWTVPVAWMILPYLIVARPSEDPVGILTLISQNGDQFIAFVTAVAVWLLGTSLATYRTPWGSITTPR